jgi:hypothetical protein
MDNIKEFIHLLPDFVVVLTLISAIVLTYFQGYRQGYKERDNELRDLWKYLEPSLIDKYVVWLHDYLYENSNKEQRENGD